MLHLASPAHTANVSARRCIGPALSQSPARSGHSTCMRKIFDDPLRPLSLRHQDVIYPSLPNVSRQLQPLKKRYHGCDAVPRLHRSPPQEYQPDRDEPRASAHSASLSSSESWSNDSIYLEVKRLNASPSLATSPDERVRDWLLTTHHDGGMNTGTEMTEDLEVCLDGPVPRDRTVIMHNNVVFKKSDMSTNEVAAYSPLSQRQISDTCEIFDFNQAPATQADRTISAPTRLRNAAATATDAHVTPLQTCTSSSQEDYELRLLSPNVCTERGRSKHGNSRTTELSAGTPSASPRLPFRYQQLCLKENEALYDGTARPGP